MFHYICDTKSYNQTLCNNKNCQCSTNLNDSYSVMLMWCLFYFQYNHTVQELDLTGNNIGDLGAIYLAEMLSVNNFITTMVWNLMQLLNTNFPSNLGLLHVFVFVSIGNLNS